MGLSLLGGALKGFNLSLPKNINFRPTSVMLRRKLFDAHQSLENTIFIDLFSGSGSMGLEALSRGAEQVFLNEKNKKTFSLLKGNVGNIVSSYPSLSECITTSQLSAEEFLKRNLGRLLIQVAQSEQNLILFIDPPYANKSSYTDCLYSIQNQLQEKGYGQIDRSDHILIWVESCYQKGLKEDELSALLVEKKVYRQGTSFIGKYGIKYE